MVVNKRYGEFMTRASGRTEIFIDFDDDVSNVFFVSNQNGKLKKAELKENRLIVKIDGGGAILLKLEIK